MTTFRINPPAKTTPAQHESRFAVGKDTGSLYLVYRLPAGSTPGNGIVIVGRNGLRPGSGYPITAEEILPLGTTIEILA